MPKHIWVLSTAWQKVFPNPHRISSDRNRVAKLTETYVKDPPRLREELDRLDLNSLNPDEQELWYRVRGTLEHRVGNRDVALEFYERGLDAFPSSPVLTFSCAQEHEYRGHVDKAFELFRRVDLKSAGSRYTLEVSRYFYLWDLLEGADKAIQWIFDAYYELQEADDNFLHIRNLPFYSTTFGCRATHAILGGRPDFAREELRKSARDIHSYDFDQLVEHLEAAVTGDWSVVLKRLAAKVDRLGAVPGNGYLTMKEAALKVLPSRSLAEACSTLDEVKPGERDHRWLEDVRTVCKARASHQFGDVGEEQRIVEAFLERQPHLFEPFNAFDFGLIAYQELLKSTYRDRRIRSASSRAA